MTNQQKYNFVVMIAIIEIANLTCFCDFVAIFATLIEIERIDFRMIDFAHFVITIVDMNNLIDINVVVVKMRKHYFVYRIDKKSNIKFIVRSMTSEMYSKRQYYF